LQLRSCTKYTLAVAKSMHAHLQQIFVIQVKQDILRNTVRAKGVHAMTHPERRQPHRD
jgi:hypothetical protein